MYKPKSTVHPFNHAFCIVCNPEIEPEDYVDWAVEMGSENPPASAEGLHPCLYVYTSNNTDIDDVKTCESLVCDGGATYNDMVNTSNGNFDLDPILNP